MKFKNPFKRIKKIKDTLVLSLSKKQQKTPIPRDSSFIDDWRFYLRLSNWAYENVPEVYTAFNRISETVCKAIDIEEKYKDIKKFHKDSAFKTKISNIMLQSLINGVAIIELTTTKFEIHNTADYIWTTDTYGNIINMKMRKNIEYELGFSDLLTDTANTIKINPETFDFFILKPRFSGDKYGMPAVKPALKYIDLTEGILTATAKSAKRYVKPSLMVNAPEGATSAERQSVYDQIKEHEDIDDMVLPAGFEAKVIGVEHQFQAVDIINLITNKTITALGIPRIALTIPEGTNRASAKYSLDLLYDKCVPYAEILVDFLNRKYKELFLVEPFKVKRLSALDLQEEAKSKMLNAQALNMLAQATKVEGISHNVKRKIEQMILNFKEKEI